MAGASDRINTLIAREFSFVQELVWLPPRRNPFPRCTDKIVSDFRKLEVLYRQPANVSVKAVTGARNKPKSSRRVADHALSILTEDADELIRLRRSICKQLLSVQASSSLNEFEHQAEALIMQHLDNGWGSCKHGSVETWACKVKGLDFKVLDMALQQMFVILFGYAIDHRGDHGDHAHDSDKVFCERKVGHKNDEIEIVSIATSLHDAEEEEDDELSELDSIGGDPADQNQELSLVLVSKNETKRESKSNIPNIKSSRGNLPIQMEMTMKARICMEHITAPNQYCWHIIFGIVNHDHCEVAVHSLTYWSLDNESEVSTIKWPQGGVILKEAPSLLCYSCQMHCNGPSDSPRVAFSWHYRILPRYPVLRKGSNEEIKERPIEPLSLELQNSVVGIKQASKDPLNITGGSHSVETQLDVPSPSQTACQVSNDPFYKRLSNFLSLKDSCKKVRKSSE